RPGGDTPGKAVRCESGCVLAYGPGSGDPPDLVAKELGKPQRPIWPHGDAFGLAVRRGDGMLADAAGGGCSGGIFGGEICKPQGSIRPQGDVRGPAARRGYIALGDRGRELRQGGS